MQSLYLQLLLLFTTATVAAASEDATPPPFFLQDTSDNLCLAGETFKRCSVETLWYVVGSPGTSMLYCVGVMVDVINLMEPALKNNSPTNQPSNPPNPHLQARTKFTSAASTELLTKKTTACAFRSSPAKKVTRANSWTSKSTSAVTAAPKRGIFSVTMTRVTSSRPMMARLVWFDRTTRS